MFYLYLLFYSELNGHLSTVYMVIRPLMVCMLISPDTFRVHQVTFALSQE